MGIVIELPKQEVLDFFFEAGTKTYAGGMTKTSIKELPGSRVLVYARPPYRYVDCYFSVGERSFGQTGIWHEALPSGPVWGMQYWGWCKDKRAIPFLKRALLAAYEERIFLGGRGPKHFSVGNEALEYQNYLSRPGNFSDSEGEEKIWDTTPDSKPLFLFHHDYNCFTLVHLS